MGSPVAELFGRNLRRIRLARGLSQEDLMARADVHRTQISNYERGEVEPQLEILARLAKGLDVDLDRLVEGIGRQAEPPRLLIDAPGPEEPIGLPVSASRRRRSRPRALPASPRNHPTVIVE